MRLKYIWIANLVSMMLLIIISYIMVNNIGVSYDILSPKSIYFLQMAMILLTIVSAPAALKLINRNRFTDVDSTNKSLSKYEIACICRIMYFSLILVLNCIFFILTSNVSFFYLSIIIFFMTLFARGN